MSSYSPYRMSDYGDSNNNKTSSSYLSRPKSPYRSNSSLSRVSHDANLKIDPDYFNLLNKSLGAHDSSFLSKDEEDDSKSSSSGPNYSRYSYGKNKSSASPSKSNRFNVNRLNKDYSTTNYGKFDGHSSDYDYNNNLSNLGNKKYSASTSRICSSGVGGAGLNSGSESDYELSYGRPGSGLGTSSANLYSSYNNKGDHLLVRHEVQEAEEEVDSQSSDESMSEYLHCKSFCPDTLGSSSKLFHGPRSGASSSSSLGHTHAYHHQHSHELSDDMRDVEFVPIAKLTDQQAIRTADFHPNGSLYAIGSNSKLLRVYKYVKQENNKDDNNNALTQPNLDNETAAEPEVVYQRTKYHKGSIYCLSWNKIGNLLATGSNDKTVKLIQFDEERNRFSMETELTMHDGTIRDMVFMDDLTNRSSLLLSGGAGDCKIYITDCETTSPFISLSGHSNAILSLYTWGGAMFVSGSQDRTIRFWDMRTNNCINLITCPTISRSKPGGAVASVVVDPTGKLLVAGYEDSKCMLYDIRGGRVIQTFHPHSSDVRTIRFSNKAYYLLSGGYDNKIVLTDLQGDLTQPLKSVVVAEHDDKVIQLRWHPQEFTFLSTSADKSAILWSLPEEDGSN